MVDKSLFVSMSGAQQGIRSLQVLSNNLANTNTVGFRADYEASTKPPQPIGNGKLQTRYFEGNGQTYSDFKSGPIMETGNELDIAINGRGFIAVQTKSGTEAYTRAGNLRLSPEGFVTTAQGDLVLGAKGLIEIPAAKKINIGETGIIRAQLLTQSENELTDLGAIKLVDIPTSQLQKGPDGLFHLIDDGATAPAAPDGSIRLLPGALEGSNVDPVKALVELIDTTRQFEMHTKLMGTVDDNAKNSNQLLNVTE